MNTNKLLKARKDIVKAESLARETAIILGRLKDYPHVPKKDCESLYSAADLLASAVSSIDTILRERNALLK